MAELDRRALIAALPGLCAFAPGGSRGQRVAEAARRQLGVTRGYDPVYRRIAYPGGDVPRATGVCADVVVRAARDALGQDLQRLVHEDMGRAFASYPSKATWGLSGPDANIDHRRVLNLEVFWRRAWAELWRARTPTAGAEFPATLQPGDFLTWRLWGRLPHVAVVSDRARHIIHNIGGGVQEIPLWEMTLHRAIGHYRWPA